MLRVISCGLAAAALAVPTVGAFASPRDVETIDPDCTVVRILPSGRKVVRAGPGAGRSASHRSARSSVSGMSASAGGSSSVSVSSSSNSGGSATASSTSNGRTVTTTHDDNGCTVTIDDRGRRGDRR